MSTTGSGGLHVAVVGATGVAGSSVLRILEERHFPVARLHNTMSALCLHSLPLMADGVASGPAR